MEGSIKIFPFNSTRQRGVRRSSRVACRKDYRKRPINVGGKLFCFQCGREAIERWQPYRVIHISLWGYYGAC